MWAIVIKEIRAFARPYEVIVMPFAEATARNMTISGLVGSLDELYRGGDYSLIRVDGAWQLCLPEDTGGFYVYAQFLRAYWFNFPVYQKPSHAVVEVEYDPDFLIVPLTEAVAKDLYIVDTATLSSLLSDTYPNTRTVSHHPALERYLTLYAPHSL